MISDIDFYWLTTSWVYFFIKTTFSFSHFHCCHGFSSSLIRLSSKTIFSINNQLFDGKSATKVMSAGIIQSLNFKIVVLPVKLNLAGLTFCIFDSPFLRKFHRERFVLPVNNFLWHLFRLLGVKGMKIDWLTPFFAH